MSTPRIKRIAHVVLYVRDPEASAAWYKDVLGIARDSPIYYQMKKVQKDLLEAKETLARFDVRWQR